jgi:hydrogenase expression/formation protein HypD
VGFETTVPLIAAAIERAPQRLDNFSVFSAHKTVPGALRALVDDPDVAVDGFILPGHVSTIIGLEPYRFLAEEYGVPASSPASSRSTCCRASGCSLKQLAEKRADVEIAYTRGVRPRATPRRERSSRRSSSRATPSGVASGSSPARDCDPPRVRALRCPPARPGRARAASEIKGCQCGEVLRGVTLPFECRALREGMHAGAPGGAVHGLLGRLVRGLLPLHRPREGVTAHGRYARGPACAMDSTPYSSPTASGGTLMRRLIDEVFVTGFGEQLS